MAWTSAQLAALDAAIAQGVLEVEFTDGRRVRYQSLSDMLKLRQIISNEIAGSSSSTDRYSLGTTRKG